MVRMEKVNKVIVTISREKLWLNFMDSARDMALNVPMGDWNVGIEVGRVAVVLLTDGKTPMSGAKLRGLFREGMTAMLMGDLMEFLDTNEEIVREIEVTDNNGHPAIIIKDEDIMF